MSPKLSEKIHLHFESDLAHQQQAIQATIDLFKGQPSATQGLFTVTPLHQIKDRLLDQEEAQQGIGNRLEIDQEQIQENLSHIQRRNNLPPTKLFLTPLGADSRKNHAYDFDIEMETGTGKTYVYLRTILELNKQYGFTKFIIVVPSIAIKEGVYKSLEITKTHLKELYDNVNYDYFLYDSSKLDQVRNFAVNNTVQIMVINIDAFRKSFEDNDLNSKSNIIHRPSDHLNGMRPIELIQETHPFVIIDEPQSVDTTPKSKEAIASLQPLCIFRYSATHVEKHTLIYKLDAVDSYNLGLVKQIEVAGLSPEDDYNAAYMKLISVENKDNSITAKIELDVKNNDGSIKRKNVTVKAGDDLAEKAKREEIYNGYIINEISCEKGNEFVTFTSKPEQLSLGISINDINVLEFKGQQIRKTIEEHLNKELILNKQGVKVLSLFFIDRVKNYRSYDNEGNPQKGTYAQLFEKHYQELIKKEKYKELHLEGAVEEVHNGYFSADKKGVLKDTSGATLADEDIYNLIMKDKERLLSMKNKLRFIFSHSALREGWDNPNVFQICTLNETHSEVKKRQEIGRGLRLCVNGDGERLHGFSINTLTVMANESYESFARALQREYETENGMKFGIIEKHSFANIPLKEENGVTTYLDQEGSSKIYEHFVREEYIDNYGRVQDKLKEAIKENNLNLPVEYQQIKEEITHCARRHCSTLNIKNHREKKTIKLNKKVYLDPQFKELWDKIKHKTTYSVQFDSQVLIKNCGRKMRENLTITARKLIYTKAKIDVSRGGLETQETTRQAELAENTHIYLPDIITYLQNETNLTRRTIATLLVQSETLELFKRNPQQYMEQTAKIINAEMKLMLTDGIKYTKIGDDEFYAQELFEKEELIGYLNQNMIESKKSVYDHIVYDSINEKNFATSFELNQAVKLYAKLPDWFKISTPLGTYNPDWVVLIKVDGRDKLYFVLETKANIAFDSLRPIEKEKIRCGKKHFEALGQDAVFEATDNFEDFITNATLPK